MQVGIDADLGIAGIIEAAIFAHDASLGIGKADRGVAIFAKAFLGIPALKSGKNYATAYAFGCPTAPAVLLHSLHRRAGL